MELCISRVISKLPQHNSKLVFPNISSSHLQRKISFPLKHCNTALLTCYANSPLRSTTSEETSTGVSQYVKDEPDPVTTVEDKRLVEEKELNETVEVELPKENSSLDDQFQLSDFLEKVNIKLDSGDSYSVLLFGGVSLFTLWLTIAIVGAIDSIPLIPKFLEIVGLGYTFWFTTRYLLFKESRDELAVKIDEIKQQVVGSVDD